jgi:iron complex transport system ATP-binding protein
MSMIQAKSVGARLGSREVLHDVSLSVGRGEIVGLLGPNGAGKSTLMRAIVGQTGFTGAIAIDGRDVTGLSAADRARHVAYLPQQRVIGWPIRVIDLVRLGRLPWQGSTSAAQDDDACRDALGMMDASDLADRTATALSGGEQARVLAARAIAQATPLIVADEPVAGLDPAHQMTMMRGFRDLAAQGRSVLVSLHDLTLAARWCDRLVVLAGGTVAAAGEPAAVMTTTLLRDVFGIVARVERDEHGLMLTPLALADRTG